MYKWHVHSAIGRSRPLAGDFSKVADGIAASLRQFHISASRAAEDGGNDALSRPSRAQRSAAAAAEISSLSAGGIDARSLAAIPPPSFTIRRVDQSKPAVMRPPGVSGVAFRGQGLGMRGNSGSFRGRGGTRGRGGRGNSGRGGRGNAERSARKRQRGPSKTQDFKIAPYTPEEQAYLDSVEMGVPTPAKVGLTDLETLKRDAPGMAALAAPIGLVNTIREHYRAFAGESGNERLSTEEHARHYQERGATLFVDEEDRAKAIGPDRWVGSPETYETLDKEEQESILQTLVAGHYRPVNPMLKGDTLATVDAYAQKNETYLPKDTAALKSRVQRMLPSQSPPKQAKQVERH